MPGSAANASSSSPAPTSVMSELELALRFLKRITSRLRTAFPSGYLLHEIDGFVCFICDIHQSIAHYQAGVEDNTLIQPHPFFDNSKYVFIKEVEVKASDGRWRSARIFGRKELPTTNVIFFGGNECEGLNGDFKMDPLTGRIFDGERRIIEARSPQKNFRSVRRQYIHDLLSLL